MPLRYRVWSDEEQAKLKAMIEHGASAVRVAVALKRPFQSIKTRARDLGMPFRHEVDLKRERKKMLGT